MNTASFDLKFIRAVGFLFDSHSDHFERIVFHSQIKPFFLYLKQSVWPDNWRVML